MCLQCPACSRGFHKQLKRSLYCFRWYPPTLLADKGLGSMEAVSTLRSHCVSTHFPASLSISYLLRSYACGRFILLSSEQPTPFFLLRLTQSCSSTEVFPLLFVQWGLQDFADAINEIHFSLLAINTNCPVVFLIVMWDRKMCETQRKISVLLIQL